MNKKTLLFLFVVSFVLAVSAKGFAEEFQIVGPKALGMGGAHVAAVNDSTASYWNPAVYGTFGPGGTAEKTFSGNLPLGAGYLMHETNISEALDTLEEVDFEGLQEVISTGNITTADQLTDVHTAVVTLLALAEDKIGATLLLDGGLYFQYRNYGIGVVALGDANTYFSIDTENIGITNVVSIDELINLASTIPITFPAGIDPGVGNYFLTLEQRNNLIAQIEALGGDWATPGNAETYVDVVDKSYYIQELAGEDVPTQSELSEGAYVLAGVAQLATAGGNIANNESSAILKGLALIEVPLTYGYAIPQNILGGDLSVGGNLKYMYAQTIDREITITGLTGKEIFDPETLLDDIETASNFGIDLGALYQYKFVFRNFYELPSRFGLVIRNLNQPSFNDIKVGPQIRFGISLLPFDFLTVACDIDVLKNDTYIEGLDSQNISFGIEGRPLKWLALRGGIYDNILETDIGGVYTLGLGLNFTHFHFDLATAFAPEVVTVEGLADEMRTQAPGIGDFFASIFGDDIPKDLRIQLIMTALF